MSFENIEGVFLGIDIVVIRRTAQGDQILTQTRNVPDKNYGRQEAIAETVEPGELIGDAIQRALREELGCPDIELKMVSEYCLDRPERPTVLLFGFGSEIKTSLKEGKPMHWISKVEALVQHQDEDSGGKKRMWLGICFLVLLLPPSLEPERDEDGEISGHKWWYPSELSWKLQDTPDEFVDYHQELLALACERTRG